MQHRPIVGAQLRRVSIAMGVILPMLPKNGGLVHCDVAPWWSDDAAVVAPPGRSSCPSPLPCTVIRHHSTRHPSDRPVPVSTACAGPHTRAYHRRAPPPALRRAARPSRERRAVAGPSLHSPVIAECPSRQRAPIYATLPLPTYGWSTGSSVKSPSAWAASRSSRSLATTVSAGTPVATSTSFRISALPSCRASYPRNWYCWVR